MPGETGREKKRIPLLDGWRGSAVLLMLGWHFCWDLAQLGCLPPKIMAGPAATLLRYAVAFSFIFLAGVSCRLSRNNRRRGWRTLLCAGAVTLVTWAAGTPVWFGILHLLGCGMLLYAGVGRRLEGLPETVGTGACLLLFAICFVALDGVRAETPGLWILGFRTADFVSLDYYPLLPWLPLFLAGTFAGGAMCRSEGGWKEIEPPGFLCFVGRHALLVYLVHQPLLWGILALCASGKKP